MNKTKIILTILTIITTANITFADINKYKDTPFVYRKQKQENRTPNKTKITEFKNLRTTYIPGIYCQIVSNKGTYEQQKHYFYNTNTQELVEIPGVYYISPQNFKKALGNLLPEFEKYGTKTNEFTHKGTKYKVPTY